MSIQPMKFDGEAIRRVYDETTESWWFSVVDVVQVLTQQSDDQTARKYWNQLKRRLAKEGHERMQEMADPALSLNRARETWQQHGRSEKWIQQPMTGQETRNKLTDYWTEHGVKSGLGFAILTNIIHQEWAGLNVQEHKALTPKRTQNADTYAYFGDPVFVYFLKDGINDGFLTPFHVKQIATTVDEYVYTAEDEVLMGQVPCPRRHGQSGRRTPRPVCAGTTATSSKPSSSSCWRST
jgi:hypothetical protein